MLREQVPLLRIRDVTVVRGEVKLLDGLSLEIPAEQHVAIVGPNGAGKTSLLKLLLRQLYPSIVDGPRAVVEILGSDVWNVWEMRRGMGVISPELDRMFPDASVVPLTILETVLTGFFGSQLPAAESDVSREMRARAIDALRQVGIAEMQERTINTLSTGELRRAMIARALVHEPRALVLDEPTTGLDLGARYRFVELLRELSRRGIAMLLVTHHLEEILPEIERVILMGRGRVVADGRKAEVLTDTAMTKLFGVGLQLQVDSQGFYAARPGSQPMGQGGGGVKAQD